MKSVSEKKHDLEVSLKNCKTNEKFLNSEMEHLRKQIEEYEFKTIPAKDKELQSLSAKLKDVIY